MIVQRIFGETKLPLFQFPVSDSPSLLSRFASPLASPLDSMIMPFTPTPATTIPIVTAEAPVTTAVPDAARVAEPLAAVPTEKEPPPPRKPAIKLLITCHEFQKFKHVIHEWLGDTQYV